MNSFRSFLLTLQTNKTMQGTPSAYASGCPWQTIGTVNCPTLKVLKMSVLYAVNMYKKYFQIRKIVLRRIYDEILLAGSIIVVG